MSRHSFPEEAKIRPFESLNSKIWAAFSFNYCTFVVSCIIIFYLCRPDILSNERPKAILWALLGTTIDPSGQYWFKILKSGAMFQVLVVFNLWTFNVLYGINLRDSLIIQRFELEVNSWDDITMLQTHITVLRNNDLFIANVAPNRLYYHFYAYSGDAKIERVRLQFFKDYNTNILNFVKFIRDVQY